MNSWFRTATLAKLKTPIGIATATHDGAAIVWFDNLARSHPPTTWSAFLDEFRRVYLSARGLDNEFDRLRSLRMTSPIQEFVAEFNARLARCENTPSRSAICDFRGALSPVPVP